MTYETAFIFLNQPAEFYAGVFAGLFLGFVGSYILFYRAQLHFFKEQIKHLKDELEREQNKREQLNNYYIQALTGKLPSEQNHTTQNQADNYADKRAD